MSNPTKQPYTVTRRLTHDGVDYLPGGDPVELTDDQAELLNAGTDPVVIPIDDKANPDADSGSGSNSTSATPIDADQRLAAIKTAIAELDPNDEAHWTKDKKPDATVLSERLGWQVKAAERDQAWAEVSS